MLGCHAMQVSHLNAPVETAPYEVRSTAPPGAAASAAGVARCSHHLEPLLLMVWVLLNWGWVCWFGFTNDDFVWIAGADLSGRPDWWWQAFFPQRWSLGFFRPLVQLSFVLNYLACGLHPCGYYLVNVGLHAANAFFVWRLALAVLDSPPAAMMTAMVFAVHPTETDAVAWVSGRTELLCALFFLPAVLAHLKGRLGWALALFALALCAKESALSLPPVVLAADWCGLGKSRRLWRDAAAYGAVVVGYLLVRAATVQLFAMGVIGLHATAVGAPLRTWITLLGRFLLEPLPMHGFIRSAVMLSVGCAAALLYSRRCDARAGSAIRLALAWVVCTQLPYISWMRLYGLYLYLTVVGMSLLLVVLAVRLAGVVLRSWYRVLMPVGAALWLIGLMVHLQTANEYQRRASMLSLQIVHSIVSAVPAPPPHTLFVVTGVERLRIGANAWVNNRGVLVFGLPEALQLWFRDRTLDVAYGSAPAATLRERRPIIFVHWDEQTGTAHRISPEPPVEK